jgi:decaprenylphospho-beta-D-erythro-pentofuranosid-2-ulose 2-reductase
MTRIVIIGATSSIAEHCARLWVAQGNVELTLVARNTERIASIATDLQVRSPGTSILKMTCDFLNPTAIQELVDEIVKHGLVDVVLIAHGSLPSQQECEQNLSLNAEALQLNGISPILFAEAFAKPMAVANQGCIAIISSVAGDRGRKSNYVYGAAKGMASRYAQGLQHRFASSNVKIILIKPGPTDTPMTAHLKQQGVSMAPVHQVAQAIVNGISDGATVLYVPGKWRMIMSIIIHLPAFVFNKLNI